MGEHFRAEMNEIIAQTDLVTRCMKGLLNAIAINDTQDQLNGLGHLYSLERKRSFGEACSETLSDSPHRKLRKAQLDECIAIIRAMLLEFKNNELGHRLYSWG